MASGDVTSIHKVPQLGLPAELRGPGFLPSQPYLPPKQAGWDLVVLLHLNLTLLRKAHPAASVQVGTLDHSPNLTFRRGQINAVLLTEVDREDGVGGSVIAEPVRAVVRCGSVNADHEISIQEDLRQEVRGINEELHLL